MVTDPEDEDPDETELATDDDVDSADTELAEVDAGAPVEEEAVLSDVDAKDRIVD